MDDKTKKHGEILFNEELDKKLKQAEDFKEHGKDIPLKTQANKNFEHEKNVKNKKILGILGGIIAFFITCPPTVYMLVLFRNAVVGDSTPSLYLFGIILSIMFAVRVYNLITGENIDINEWIKDKFAWFKE